MKGLRVALLSLSAACLFPLVLGSCGGGGGGGPKPSPSVSATPAPNRWPMLAQNPSSTYDNTSETTLSAANVASLREEWRLEVSGIVYGAPAVVDGNVYAQATGAVYALNGRTGAALWVNTAVGGTSAPTYSNGTLFVNDKHAVLHALDAATGNEKWRATIDTHPFAAGYSSPVVTGRFVIVGSSSNEEYNVREGATFRGSVVAFDRDTGQELWRYYTVDPPFNGATVWSTVSVDETAQLVFAGTGNTYTGQQAAPNSDSILALDLNTGSVRWARQLSAGDVFTIPNPKSPDSDFGTNPILFEATIAGTRRRLLAAGQKSGVFHVLDRDNGTIVWQRQVSGGSALIGGVFNNGAYDGQRLILAGNQGTSSGPGSEPSNNSSGKNTTSVLEALDPASGGVLWERQLPAWVWAPITLANGVGFVAVDKELQAFRTDNGQKLFTFGTGGTIACAPTIAEGRVHFGSGLSYFTGTSDNTLHVLGLEAPAPSPSPTATPPTPGGQPTFTAIYNEIIVGQTCTTCHFAPPLNFNTNDQAYAQLVGVPASGPFCGGTGKILVVPGNPDASLLVDKVSNAKPSCGAVMPPSGPLPAAQIQQIRDWISAGAKNN